MNLIVSYILNYFYYFQPFLYYKKCVRLKGVIRRYFDQCVTDNWPQAFLTGLCCSMWLLQSRITLRERNSLWTQRNGIVALPASRETNALSFLLIQKFLDLSQWEKFSIGNWFLYSSKIFGPDQNILVWAKICFKLLEGQGNWHKSREDQCTAVVYQRPKQLTEPLAIEF